MNFWEHFKTKEDAEKFWEENHKDNWQMVDLWEGEPDENGNPWYMELEVGMTFCVNATEHFKTKEAAEKFWEEHKKPWWRIIDLWEGEPDENGNTWHLEIDAL